MRLTAPIAIFLLASSIRADGLLEAEKLLRSTNPEDREKGAALAAKLGESAIRLVPQLAKNLGHDSPHVRASAEHALKAIGPAAFGVLVRSLASSDPEVRTSSANVLVQYSAVMECVETDADRLVAALGDGDLRVRCAIAPLFSKFAPGSAPALLAAFRSEDPFVRETAARALARHCASADLSPHLDATQWTRRDAAARTLGRLADPRATPMLVRLLQDEQAAVRRQAAKAIGRRCADAGAVMPALHAGFEDPDRGVRLACADAVAAFGGLARAAAIEEVQSATSAGVRRAAAARVLAWLGGADEEILLALASEATDVRAEVALMLGPGPPPSSPVIARVRSLLEDGSEAVRAAAAHTLSGLEVHMEEALRVLLLLPNNEVAIAALSAHGWRASPAAATLVASLKGASPPLRRAIVGTLAAVLLARPADFASAWQSLKSRPPEVQSTLLSARKWLLAQQTEAGGWDSAAHQGLAAYDVGVSGLAMLALRATGPETAEALQKARGFLASRQRDDGWLAPQVTNRLCQHSIATWALAEVLLIAPDRRLRDVVERAARVIEHARNPGLGWGYEPCGGQSDTHETAWAASALRFARLARVPVSPQAEAGALTWLYEATDREFGQVGYNVPGGYVARLRDPGVPTTGASFDREGRGGVSLHFPPEESQGMTAAAVWCHGLLREPDRVALRGKGRQLLLERMPKWNRTEGTIDLCYWHWGSLALAPQATREARSWYEALDYAIVTAQARDGSWDPVDAWASVGGRAYSTAMATLALLGPQRYPAMTYDLAVKPDVQNSHLEAALKGAAGTPDPEVRYAAQRALAGLAPFED